MNRLTNIPTNIITGFLGVGKTTAIQALLKQKPKNETWAILVNELGQIGIDQSALPQDDSGIVIKELAGGCICCALGPVFTTTLAMLLRRSKPDRLLIEPTGIGHPAGIIDTLQSAQFKEVLDLRSVVCLLDPRSLENTEIINLPTFQDQINLADIIVLNKNDLCDQTQIRQAKHHVQAMFPPKQSVVESTQGDFDITLLDYIRLGVHSAAFPETHQKTPTIEPTTAQFSLSPQPNSPLSKQGNQSGYYSSGWVFHPDDIFDAEALYEYLKSLPELKRIKGVFNTNQGWVFFNQVGKEHSVTPLAYRRESRIEMISQTPQDWTSITQHLLQQLITDQ